LKFPRLQLEERCIIVNFPDFNRKSVTLFEVSHASTGRALHYSEFPRLQPEERCIILNFPGFNLKSILLLKVSKILTSSLFDEKSMHLKMSTNHW
jgi:hypothetical protein